MSINARRLVNPLGSAYLAVLTVVSAVGGALVATTWFQTETAALLGIVLCVLGFFAVGLLTYPARPPRIVAIALAWALSALLMFASAIGFYTAVLHARGERIEATVLRVRDSRDKGRHLYYSLADPGGSRIAGELGAWPGAKNGASHNPEGEVGARVTVIRDPEGLVDPRLPDEVNGLGAAFVWLVVFAAVAVACMFAGRAPTAG